MSTTVYGTGDSASPPPFASLFEGDGRGGDTPPAPTVYTNDSVAVSLVEEVAATPADRPVVCLWLRHYGCTLCKKAAAEASEALGGADGAGAPLLIAIGCGTPEQAVAFQADIGFQGTLYSDPRRDTYEALRFKSGVSSVFNLPALGKVLSSFASGYSQACPWWAPLPPVRRGPRCQEGSPAPSPRRFGPMAIAAAAGRRKLPVGRAAKTPGAVARVDGRAHGRPPACLAACGQGPGARPPRR